MTEQEANELEKKLINAWLTSDWETINSLLDDGWSVIDPAGRILTKALVVEEAKTGDRKMDSGTVDELKVRSLGDVAVVTGRTVASGTYQGNSASVRLRFTDVCVRRDRGWQVVASQGTLIS
jgi:ketosteroid isomerase-like protein